MRRKLQIGTTTLALALSLILLPEANAASAARSKSAKPVKELRAPAKPGKVQRAAKRASKSVAKRLAVIVEPVRASFGHLSGLQKAGDALDLKSSVALVVDQDTDEVLFSKNPQAVLPIASITKLMTALVVTESNQSLAEMLTVTDDDVAATTGSSSRLKVGTTLSRGEMLHLALMSSENRAAHVLGRSHPGGIAAFIPAMNHKATALGMSDTRYVEPTGLSSDNQSSAKDLTRLVRAAYSHPIIRDLSTSTEMLVPVGERQVQFRTTNGLVRNPEWSIGLQKTGYIAAAGRCVVMQAQMAGRKLIMVLLDSAGTYSRIGDAERLRKWIGSSAAATAGTPPAEIVTR